MSHFRGVLGAALVLASAASWGGIAQAQSRAQIAATVKANVASLLPANKPWGAAFVVRTATDTLYYNFGNADAANDIPMSSKEVQDLASCGKLFTALMLGAAVDAGTVQLTDPVDKYLTQLQSGKTIRQVTLGMLASHSSGLPDTPGPQPWHPSATYDEAAFIKFLNRWKGQPCPPTGPCTAGEPGKQYIYSDAGFILLRMALEAALDTSYADELGKITTALGLTHTTLDMPKNKSDVVQGYTSTGKPESLAQEQSAGVFDWSDGGQIFSNADDMAIFAQLALDQLADKTLWQPAMLETQKPLFTASPLLSIGMAWQFTTENGVHIVDKDGALPFTSTYVGVVPAKQLAIVILVNSGNAPATGVGRKILERLAGLASSD